MLAPRLEGISDWIAQTVSGHLLARQKGCNLYLDYGPDVDIHQVLTPSSNNNWTVPDGFDCNNNKHYFRTQPDYRNGIALEFLERRLGHLSMIPNYRFAYHGATNFQLNASDYEDIKRALPGFEVETGMACSLASLFHLAPTAAQFQPDLFTRILPTLHQPNALVMTLYIRTTYTDDKATKEKAGQEAPAEDLVRAQRHAKRIITCALGLEQEYLSKNRGYTRVVWMVVTDSPYVKQWITKTHDMRNATIPREIVTTRSRGAHTRPERGPSTVDFAEALIDWYLIGESDLVIKDSNGPSFAGTAALRTARPLYAVPYFGDASQCSFMPVVH